MLGELDISRTPLEIFYKDVDKVDNITFIQLRREGFGGSDAGVLLGVNPYQSIEELLMSKIPQPPTQNELMVGLNPAVQAGTELEPLVIKHMEEVFKRPVIKPVDMYHFKDYPYLAMNFDGVLDIEDRYIPDEVKVVTLRGARHYQPHIAWYRDTLGFGIIPEDISTLNVPIQTKADHYGIPAYYYTQVQQEMLALNAPYAYLTAYFQKTGESCMFYIWKDQAVQNQIILQGWKAWQKVEEMRRIYCRPTAGSESTLTEPLPLIPPGKE